MKVEQSGGVQMCPAWTDGAVFGTCVVRTFSSTLHPPRDMENVLVAIMAMALPILYSTALDVPLLAVLCTSPNRSPGALLYGCSWRYRRHHHLWLSCHHHRW